MRFTITSILFILALLSVTSIAHCSEPEIHISFIPVKCFNGHTGKLLIDIADISQNYSAYLYKNSPQGTSLNAVENNDTTSFIASNLNAGKYFIEIKGDKGFAFTKSIELEQPEILGFEPISIEKKLSSPDANDAVLKANPKGGTPPYTYQWDTEGRDKNSQIIENIKQGVYSCIINDVNNCGPVKASILLNQPVNKDIIQKQ